MYTDDLSAIGRQIDETIANLRGQIVDLEASIEQYKRESDEDNAIISDLNSKIAELNAEIARLNKLLNPQPTGPNTVCFQDIPAQPRISLALARPEVKGKQVSFPEGLFETAGFLDQGNPPVYAFFDGNSAGILGSGIDKTIFQVKPMSSAKNGWYKDIQRNTRYEVGYQGCTFQNGWVMKVVQAGTTGPTVPSAWVLASNNALPAGTLPIGSRYTDGTVVWESVSNTNPTHAMDFYGAQFKEASGFTLLATPQGHLYGGLRFQNVADCIARDIRVAGFAGTNPGNPGEIFVVPCNRVERMTFKNLDIDGRDETGARVGVSMLGLNNSTDILVDGGYFHHTRTDMGAGVAAWQVRNIRYVGTRAEDTGSRGFSHERCSGEIVLDHVTALRCKGSHAKFDSDIESAKVTIIDPIFDGPKFTVKINKNYLSTAGKVQTNPVPGNMQNPADIKLIINGVERPDLLQIF